jgi:two-component system NtrC family sensor kinase
VFAHRPIRHKLIFMLLLLLVFMTAGSLAGLTGVYTYRNTVKSISNRAKELPYATVLMRWVLNLRVITKEIATIEGFYREHERPFPLEVENLRNQFDNELTSFNNTLATYESQMIQSDRGNTTQIGSSKDERLTVYEINKFLRRIQTKTSMTKWTGDQKKIQDIDGDLQKLQASSAKLPRFLHERLKFLADGVRVEYRMLICMTWACTLLAVVTIVLFIRLFISWIFRPLTKLVDGSRQVATGDFDFRIQLAGNDEMSELADAMNNMTEQFQIIQTDLHQEVEQRTIQMVRSEKMASVGFLAAGVAHEINNPMQSISLCAESLEQRLEDHSIVDPEGVTAAKKYLRMIQDEAFRCKGITSQLLDLSRKGDETEENTDLRELTQVVVDMVVTLTKSQMKQITFEDCKSVMVVANPQEIKQVILNLINNAMESVDAGGHIRLKLGICDGMAEITVSDNGCGMTEEVRQHLFEPFFTQRRHGQGTGLGLTIAYGIIEHHGGRMEATSDGPGTGSQFRVLLPLAGTNSDTRISHFRAA